MLPVEAVTYACKSPVLNKNSDGVDAEKCDTAADTISATHHTFRHNFYSLFDKKITDF